MSKITNFLKLFIPDKTSKGTVVTNVFDPNFTKIDQFAENVSETKLDKGSGLKAANARILEGRIDSLTAYSSELKTHKDMNYMFERIGNLVTVKIYSNTQISEYTDENAFRMSDRYIPKITRTAFSNAKSDIENKKVETTFSSSGTVTVANGGGRYSYGSVTYIAKNI